MSGAAAAAERLSGLSRGGITSTTPLLSPSQQNMSAIPPAYASMQEETKTGVRSINAASRLSPPISSFSATPLDATYSFSTPHQLQPWDMSEPGGRTTYLPGPETAATDIFSTGTADGASSTAGAPAAAAAASRPISPKAAEGAAERAGGGGEAAVEKVEKEALLPASATQTSVEVDDYSGAQSSPRSARSEGGSIPSYVPPPTAAGHKKLSQWFATAICGNDITSSCFYVTGICVASAGVYAPLCMLIVAGTLFLFRSIYDVLLNTTSKSTAAMAACLTILSYMATAVVSAASAVEYLNSIYRVPMIPAVLLLLAFFACLCLWGITESADVALCIFSLHMLTLSILVLTVLVWSVQHGFPELVNNIHSAANPPAYSALFFGFASAMLGVSGFESSANFVEEQAPGVFILTLRNMWAAVAFFNPVIASLSVCVFSIEMLGKGNNPNIVLALLADQCGGWYLRYWVCIDAFLVLAGSVLTAFVGVNGLCRRLALDRCLPQFLLAENRWRGTNHVIILGFLLICASIYVLLSSSIDDLASVYAVSFLSVMSLFAVGNMLLKYKRGFLPRTVRANWLTVVVALLLVLLALAGVLAKDTSILSVWLVYFVAVGFFLAVMFFRVQSLKIVYHALHSVNASVGLQDGPLLHYIAACVKSISSQAVAFYVKSGSISILNKAVLYVRQNEDCAHIRIIHVYEQEQRIPKKLMRNVAVLDEAYPKVKIDLILVRGLFGPTMIDYLSEQLSIPKNLMFITCPKEDFTHKLESLGGVRLITH